MPDEGDELVLVTGVSGSIAGALAAALQKAGYRVRGTVRDPSNADTVRRAARPPQGAACGAVLRCRGGASVSHAAHPLTASPTGAQVGHVAALCPGIELVAADLLSDEGWDAACAGCKFVHHVASPFPIGPCAAVTPSLQPCALTPGCP
jgi:dihydroflavonol-4-reductase